MKPRVIYLVPILALMVLMIPTSAAATHERTDERPMTTLEDFGERVGSWVDPWLDISRTSIANDHSPWVAFGLYEELLGIRPEPCYWDTYAAYWAVAAGLRAMGNAPTRERMMAETERVFDDVARAEALAALSAAGCPTWPSEVDEEVDEERSLNADAAPSGATGPKRVIEVEATAALQFVDESGEVIEMIDVSPGEAVLFHVHNAAGFEHSFYIGTESELHEPMGTTDTGIGAFTSGVRELEWIVPDDVSELMFGCTVPGHFTLMHGGFRVALPSSGQLSLMS